jgi:hypothetical protein
MMKINPFLVGAVLLIAAGLVFYAYTTNAPRPATITTFDECVAAGNAIMESYPRQCRTADGELFIENIGNELEKVNLIRVTAPLPNAAITNPVTITGEARGYWFFEASFPIEILDGNGNMLAQTFIMAADEWMTEDFVSFSKVISFNAPATEVGTIILHRDNPSGLPENDDLLILPVRFVPSVPSVTPPKNPPTVNPPTEGPPASISACRPTGCSGQICADEDVITTCEYRPEYACYQSAMCARQPDGECGWTPTTELAACLGAAQ